MTIKNWVNVGEFNVIPRTGFVSVVQLYVLTFGKVSVNPEQAFSVGLLIDAHKLEAITNRILNPIEVLFECFLPTIVSGIISEHFTILDRHVVELAGHESN
jgi:hypothetical protein